MRSILLGILIIIWAFRLGTFLFLRVKTKGYDSRFSVIKTDFLIFFTVWNLQGLWILFTISSGLIALTSINKISMEFFGYFGLAVWILGFFIELVSDYQKMIFRSKKRNQEKFIKNGLWAWSRHPNYFGEVIIWVGITIIAIPVLTDWQYITLLSPVFVTILLTRISGIPILEINAKIKWGNDLDYINHIKNTPLIILRRPRKG